MKASITALVAVLTIGSLGLAAGIANAGGCGGGGGHGGGHGGHGGHHNYHHNYHRKVYVKKVYVRPIIVEPCYNPFHCFAIVNPGDTWFTLSLREYGRPHLWKKIAIFNGLPLNAGLAPGMQLRLPVINPDGSLLPSSAPAPVVLAARTPIGLPQAGAFPGIAAPQANFVPQGGPQGAPNMFQGNGPSMQNNVQPNSVPQNSVPQNSGQPTFEAPAEDAAPTANIRSASTEARLPSVAIGSILTLDGQSLGDERGIVRLKVSGIALPVEVLEWNAMMVKVQLPQLDLAGAMKAEIEVRRADGSLASNSAVELTSATNRLALGN